ncbi:hypothetical protein HAN_1g152 (nucleomorph) [Hemiselmis andersenii]|uniref:Uncharacterized protein n=1 Tax=Hemiselmis andersenii TaxID=464988 RepID=A9BKF6_HEMAN|nr:hypothetical protein HAN_1g152 [Hemiselmis andersenii]ABW97989.1 hypothetical protein HAN_1g152 [Hemiselmis andersenii]
MFWFFKKKEKFFKIWKNNFPEFINKFWPNYFPRKIFLKSSIIFKEIEKQKNKKSRDFFIQFSKIENVFKKKFKFEIFLFPLGQPAFYVGLNQYSNQNFNFYKFERKFNYITQQGFLKMKNLGIFRSEKIKKGDFVTISIFDTKIFFLDNLLIKKISLLKNNPTLIELIFFPTFNFFLGSQKTNFFKNGQLLGGIFGLSSLQDTLCCRKFKKKTILRLLVGPEFRFNSRNKIKKKN